MTEYQEPELMYDSLSDMDDANTFSPDVDYVFEIASIGPRVKTVKSFYRQFVFRSFVDGETAEVKQNMFSWELKLMVEMLKLKQKQVELIDDETGEHFKAMKIDWNDALHKAVKGRVHYEKYTYKKDGVEKSGSSPKIKIQCAVDNDNQTTADDTEEIPF